jgi:hypothetical protein
MSLASFAFQACAFSLSAISPREAGNSIVHGEGVSPKD